MSDTVKRITSDPSGRPMEVEMSKIDAAISDLFGCFEGKDVQVSVSVEGKRVGSWREIRKLTEEHAAALRQTLSPEIS